MGKIKKYYYSLEFNANKLDVTEMFDLSYEIEKLIKSKDYKITGAGTVLIGPRVRDISFQGNNKITTAFKNKLIAFGKKNKVKITINDIL